MHVCVCVYVKYQNPKINREGIPMYGCVCVYACYSNTLKSYATRHMKYLKTRIWIPSLRVINPAKDGWRCMSHVGLTTSRRSIPLINRKHPIWQWENTLSHVGVTV